MLVLTGVLPLCAEEAFSTPVDSNPITEPSHAAVPADGKVAFKDHPKVLEIESLWDAGNKSRANRVLNSWMKQEKHSPYPWVESAALRFREKKYKNALALSKEALEKSPQCAEAYYWRGRSYEAMNKPLDAANEYRAALLAKAKYEEAQEGLDRVSAVLGS